MSESIRIIEADVRVGLGQLPDEHINMVMTSVPYWSLRRYNTEPQIWGGDKNCGHIWQDNAYVRNTDKTAGKKQKTNIGSIGRDVPVQNAFCSKCSAWCGELGLEPTISQYIAHLMECFDALKPKLRKDGLVFVNIGDTYGGSGCGTNDYRTKASRSINKTSIMHPKIPMQQKMTAKCLCLIPERFALAMVEHNWILRSTIIWVKGISFAEHDCQHCHQITQYSGSCMPDSARDRPNKGGYEFVYMFSKQSNPTCWVNEKTGISADKPTNTKVGIEGTDWDWVKCSTCEGTGIVKEDVEAISTEGDEYIEQKTGEPCKRCKGTGRIKKNYWSSRDYFYEQQYEDAAYDGRQDTTLKPTEKYADRNALNSNPNTMHLKGTERWPSVSPLGERKRIIRNCWAINPQATSEKHYATFPESLVEKCIRMGCPKEICKKCGKPRYPIIKANYQSAHSRGDNYKQIAGTDSMTSGMAWKNGGWNELPALRSGQIDISYSDCQCGAGFRPGVVCDPFSGIATTGVVAYKLGMDYKGIELSSFYNEIARKRLKELLGLFDI